MHPHNLTLPTLEIPAQASGRRPIGVYRRRPFQLVSHQFAHAGLAHLWANLAALLYYGRFAERKYGGYVAAVYLLGGAAGALAHGFWGVHPLLGSSGAVSAVLGSCMFRNTGWKKAGVIVVWLVIYNVVPLFFAFDNISYAAHIGGFTAGLILGMH